MKLTVLVWCLVIVSADASLSQNLTTVTIIHINDFHARFEETNSDATNCKEPTDCVGGYARTVTVVKKLLDQYKDKHVLYLNAADNFQGTPWYNVFRWNVTSHFLNLLPADVMTVGNHEFDHDVDGLLPFLENVKSHVVLANIDVPSRKLLKDKVRGAVVVNKQGVRIGIIGVIFKKVSEASKTGDLIFLDEVETVKAYAEQLKTKGVNVILVLSHSGIDIDKKIAEEAGPNIDVIVGGHSHTYMFHGNDSKSPDVPLETYPLVVTQNSTGHKVLIVQAGAYAKYVGVLTVQFDDQGEPVRWEGNPVYLEHDIPQDEKVLKELKPWKFELDQRTHKIIGSSQVLLNVSRCRQEECLIGNLITDSMVDSFKHLTDKSGHPLSLAAVINSGGIRVSIPIGNITYGDVLTCLPFGNTIQMITVTGQVLRTAFEQSVEVFEYDYFFRYFFQVSGLRIVFDIRKPVGGRVVSLQILKVVNGTPTYIDVDNNEKYPIITNIFLSEGGDGYWMFKKFKRHQRHGPVDIDAFIHYLKKVSPVNVALQNRIKVLTD